MHSSRCLLLFAGFVCPIVDTSMALGQDLPVYLIERGAVWHLHASKSNALREWRSPDFDDSLWRQAHAGFGYGDNDDKTILGRMQGEFTRIQIRRSFDLAAASGIPDQLYLYVNFDDGFIAHLNGREIARAAVVSRNAQAFVSSHEAQGFEEFVITKPKRWLRAGRNVLAIEGFNRSLDSSDFSLHPLLCTRRIENLNFSTISQQEAQADIDELERRLEDQSSYVHRRRFDYKRALADLRRDMPIEISVHWLADRLQRLIAKLGDCHARVDAPHRNHNSAYLPFSLGAEKNGVIAMQIDRTALLDDRCPYLTSIDGRPLDDFLQAAAQYIAQGSPQLIRERSLARLRDVGTLRTLLRLPRRPTIQLTLKSPDGSRTRQQTHELQSVASPRGTVPLARTRRLANNIGYLRIAQMDNREVKQITNTMREFRNTNGLIIDVRDNGGGRYGILQALYGCFTPNDARPYVTNVAAYRLSKQFARDHLHYRPTYRLNYPHWTEAERAAIRETQVRFTPEWIPPPSQFSEWHYMVLSKNADTHYHYRKPVVVLCNSASFSATDGFLSAMADLNGVVLIGEPSGGGSGATQRFTLTNSRLQIALSSMASFRPNGKLFDGHGVDVDIERKPTINDLLGNSDSVRDYATRWIRSQGGREF